MYLSGICLGVNTLPQQVGDTRKPLTILDLEGLPVLTSDSDQLAGVVKGDTLQLDVNVRTNRSGGRTFWLNSVLNSKK